MDSIASSRCNGQRLECVLSLRQTTSDQPQLLAEFGRSCIEKSSVGRFYDKELFQVKKYSEGSISNVGVSSMITSQFALS